MRDGSDRGMRRHGKRPLHPRGSAFLRGPDSLRRRARVLLLALPFLRKVDSRSATIELFFSDISVRPSMSREFEFRAQMGELSTLATRRDAEQAGALAQRLHRLAARASATNSF